jgi:ABC-type branched-subunit amino acid transport system substrate-binding protein
MNRRCLLATGAAAAALPLAPRARAQNAEPLRIGAVLPIAGSAIPTSRVNLRAVGEAARMGLTIGEEDANKNGELMGATMVLTIANAPGPEAAARAAQRLVARDKVSVLVGGFTREEVEALSGVASQTGALFLNIGATSDALRRSCSANTFHIEASAAMYIDAVFGWFIRAGYRRWYLVHDDGPEGQDQYERSQVSLKERHWAAEVAGHGVLRQDDSRDFAPVLADVAEAKPDVVLLLTDWRTQLDFLSRYEVSGLTAPIIGFPEPATQMRDFYLASRAMAPVAGSGYRAALWEATLDAYGARELNARFDARWGRPMDPPAWAGYVAVKIAFEASLFAGGKDGASIAAFLTSDQALFDVSKGIGMTFRRWDHQLRQSLYLVKINPDSTPSLELAAMLARASLVGELPAIYMPGTEPVERLDQLGEIDPSRTCP